ncbi:MAG: hypothetical protein CMF62_03065 [Magnetococcales bacterium]|nr:hypothetical protein [Magnetococcales bacterium]
MAILRGVYFYLFNVSNVSLIYKDSTKNVYWRFLIVRFFNSIITFLKIIRDYFDVTSEKIHLIKIDEFGEQLIILDSNNNDLSLKKAIKQINNMNISTDKLFNKCKFLKFELVEEDKKICLKHILLKYDDQQKNFNNTLENIFLFNKINYDSNSKLNLKVFTNGKITDKTFNVNDVKKYHINSFYEIEF